MSSEILDKLLFLMTSAITARATSPVGILVFRDIIYSHPFQFQKSIFLVYGNFCSKLQHKMNAFWLIALAWNHEHSTNIPRHVRWKKQKSRSVQISSAFYNLFYFFSNLLILSLVGG